MSEVRSGDCVKCGASPSCPGYTGSFTPRYVNDEARGYGETGDLLEFTCTRCGYKWTRPCKDAP